jgi:uncharacterized small protein (DUF1192 family)
MTKFEKQHSDELVAAAAAKVANGMSIAQAAREAEMPVSSLSYRLNKMGVFSRGETQKKQTKADLPESELGIVNELEGRIHLMQDELRVTKAQLSAAQKNQMLLKALGEQLQELAQPIPPPYPSWQKLVKGPVKESCALHLSDGHHDSVILPHRVQDLERHDFNVAMARGENLVDTVCDFTRNRMVGYEFNTLWVLAYGDHTGGEIHRAVEHSHFGNMMRNCLAIGQFHAQMIRDLSEWFPEVKVLYLSGNHGRRKDVRKKDYQAAWDSWDYLIAETSRSYCKDLWNVEFLIPDSFSAVIEIEGFYFHTSHGDDIRGWAGVPWYGIERKTRRLMALNAAHDRRIDYYCMGHFHTLGTQQALKGETIINGAWIGTDPYAFNSLDAYNEPMQLLHGVHEKRGMTWRLPIKLRREVETPERYKVSLASPEG